MSRLRVLARPLSDAPDLIDEDTSNAQVQAAAGSRLTGLPRARGT